MQATHVGIFDDGKIAISPVGQLMSHINTRQNPSST
jgi:hypothetical protein